MALFVQYYVISISTCHLKIPCKHRFNGCVIIHHINVPSSPFSLLLYVLSPESVRKWLASRLKTSSQLARPASLAAGTYTRGAGASLLHCHLGSLYRTPEFFTHWVTWLSPPAGASRCHGGRYTQQALSEVCVVGRAA